MAKKLKQHTITPTAKLFHQLLNSTKTKKQLKKQILILMVKKLKKHAVL